MSLVLTHDAMRLHSGPNGSMECSLRLPVDSKFTQVDIQTFSLYEEFIYLVHSLEYVEFVLNRCDNVGHTNWGCSACSYTNTNIKRCEMCSTVKPDQSWEYLGTTEGDTTYINLHTRKALEAAIVSSCELSTKLARNEILSGFALVRPPGHHACKDQGQGFCLLNNTAIAAEAALSSGAKRVYVFDWDLHHGNGIQDQFYRRNDVFYCSIHGDSIYPHSGKRDEKGDGPGFNFNLNIPLPKDTTNKTYFKHFISYVIPSIVKFNPDLILIAAGFDGLKSDPINFFHLTPDIYPAMIKELKLVCPKLGLILEGGYDTSNIKSCIDLCISALD